LVGKPEKEKITWKNKERIIMNLWGNRVGESGLDSDVQSCLLGCTAV
jgi:hypothetical protein